MNKSKNMISRRSVAIVGTALAATARPPTPECISWIIVSVFLREALDGNKRKATPRCAGACESECVPGEWRCGEMPGSADEPVGWNMKFAVTGCHGWVTLARVVLLSLFLSHRLFHL